MGKTGVDDQAFAADNYNCKRIGFIEHTAQELREDNKGVRSNLCVRQIANDKLLSWSDHIWEGSEKVVTTA